METEDTKQPRHGIDRWATQMARNRAEAAMWDINLVVLLFAVLAIIIIMVSQDIDINIVAPIAIVGLVAVWVMARRRSKRLFQRFYAEELSGLHEEPSREVEAFAEELTPREKQILDYVAQGYANKRIALELDISVNTVKNFISKILTKLDASDRTEAVVMAIKHGMISLQ